jgi:hypothetical protein
LGLGGGETGIVCARVGGCAGVWPFLIIVVGLVGLPIGCPFFFLADLWLLEGVAASVFEGVSLFAAFEGVLLLLLLLFVPFFGTCFLFLVLREAFGASGGRGVEGGGGSGAFLRALFGLDGVLIVELLMVSSLSIVAVAVVGTLASASAGTSAGASVLVVVISTPVSGPLGIILGMGVGVALGVTFSI